MNFNNIFLNNMAMQGAGLGSSNMGGMDQYQLALMNQGQQPNG